MKTTAGLALSVLILTGCTQASGPIPAAETAVPGETAAQQENTEERMMYLFINEAPVEVIWEENRSVKALEEIVTRADLVIPMAMYGGFEQVGPIGTKLVSSDVQTVTSAGDIVLYSGNQIVIFYGSNTWAYTRLGHITDKTPEEMEQLLGNGDVVITVTMEEK